MAKVAFILLYSRSAIGPAHLSSFLKANGHETYIINFKQYEWVWRDKVKDTQERVLHRFVSYSGKELVLGCAVPYSQRELHLLIDLLERINPDLIAFSVNTTVFQTAARLTQELRKTFKRPFIWGGIGPTVEPERSLEYVDIICLGEGEESLLELCDCLDHNKGYSQVPNLWMNTQGRTVRNTLRPLIQDLDSLPHPDYDLENKYYIHDDVLEEQVFVSKLAGTYDIMTSRGCPFRCSYCCNSQLKALYPGQKHLRRRTVDNVISELHTARQQHDITYVRFFDEVFTLDKGWLETFSERYRRDVGLPFWCNAHPLFCKEENLRLLKDCGVDRVTSGIQSGSERVLRDIYHRPTPRQKILDSASTLRRVGINHDFDIITDNPLESEDDCRETLNLLLDLPRPFKLNSGLSKLSVFPNTGVARMIEENEDQPLSQRVFEFYNRLYLLAQYRYPRWLIEFLSKRKTLRNHPHLLRPFLILRHLLK